MRGRRRLVTTLIPVLTLLAAATAYPARALAGWSQPVAAPLNFDATKVVDNTGSAVIAGTPWVTWAEDDGTRNQIRVAQLTSAGWSFAGGSLNFSSTQD